MTMDFWKNKFKISGKTNFPVAIPLSVEDIACFGVDGYIDTGKDFEDERPIYIAPINDVLTDKVIDDMKEYLLESNHGIDLFVKAKNCIDI